MESDKEGDVARRIGEVFARDFVTEISADFEPILVRIMVQKRGADHESWCGRSGQMVASIRPTGHQLSAGIICAVRFVLTLRRYAAVAHMAKDVARAQRGDQHHCPKR